MDPIFTTANFLNVLMGVIAGMIANPSDRKISDVIGNIGKRLEEGGEPVNHDLQRAVRRAYLEATIFLCESCLKNKLGVESGAFQSGLRKLSGLGSKEIRQIEDIHGKLKAELKKFRDDKCVPSKDDADQQIDVKSFLQKKSLNIGRIPSELQESLIQKLREWQPNFPEVLETMIRDGWEYQGRGFDWYDSMRLCFANILKTDVRVRAIFECDVLTQNNATLLSLQRDFDLYLKPTLDEIYQDVKEILTILKKSAERIRPEIAHRIDEILKEYQKLFVGREEELKAIDDFISDEKGGYFLITADAGYGKTALLANWLKNNRFQAVYHLFRRDCQDMQNFEAYKNLLNQIYDAYGIDEPYPAQNEQLRSVLYSSLRHACKEKPLVMILDGLDEADAEVSAFPSLPDHVFVMVSGRAAKDENPKYLRDWSERAARRIHLESLPQAVIPEWLKQTGYAPLVALAENQDFVDRIQDITEGFPLYLRYLIEEMIQEKESGGDVQTVLNRTPKGFGRYVETQLDLLADTEKFQENEKLQQLFALLSVALGPLPKSDVTALTKLNTVQLKGLPWQVTRWFSLRESDYVFAHPLLAAEFGKALAEMAEEAKENLLRFCADWGKHKSRYALRYYAEHLYQAAQYESLYALAKDKAFRDMQAQTFLDDPHLPLMTLQTALKAAGERDAAKGMAEFSLAHARQVLEMMEETPLEALRKGSLKRAWDLADLYDIKRCVKWYLLLAWALKDEGRVDEANETLERLIKKELPRNQGDEHLTLLLSQIVEVSENIFNQLWKRLLNDLGRMRLYNSLIKKNFLSAFEVARSIENDYLRAAVIAAVEARAGGTAAALETARCIENDYLRAWALKETAVAQAHAGDTLAALETTQDIVDDCRRAEALKEIATIQARAGDRAAAIETARSIEPESDWLTLPKIAVVQAQAGEREASLNTFAEAVKTARNIENDYIRAWALKEIATAQTQAGERKASLNTFTAALETALNIQYDWRRAWILKEIAAAQAQAGDTAAAFETARSIENSRRRAESLVKIAVAQIQTGDIAAAFETVQLIESGQGDAALLAKPKSSIEYGYSPALILKKIAAAQAGDIPETLELDLMSIEEDLQAEDTAETHSM